MLPSEVISSSRCIDDVVSLSRAHSAAEAGRSQRASPRDVLSRNPLFLTERLRRGIRDGRRLPSRSRSLSRSDQPGVAGPITALRAAYAVAVTAGTSNAEGSRTVNVEPWP